MLNLTTTFKGDFVSLNTVFFEIESIYRDISLAFKMKDRYNTQVKRSIFCALEQLAI